MIYCRVSSLEQVQGTSLDQQERDCRQFCEREGHRVAAVFVDKGESAKTADRPQFQAMVAYCNANPVDAAVVWKLDRFARNSYDHAVFQAVLAKAGVEVKSVTEPLSDSPAGKLLTTMLAGIAQFDNDVRAERTKSGMRAVAAAGGWTTTPPIGYRTAKVKGLAALEPCPDQALIVRRLFSKVAEGDTTTGAAAVWLSGQLGRKIGRQSLHKILRNPVYIGIVKSSLTDHRPVRAVFDGIISDGVFQKVQSVLAGNGKVQRSIPTDSYPLRGALQCECGKLLSASTSIGRKQKQYSYYHCSCGTRARQDAVEELFNEHLAASARECAELLPILKLMVCDVWRDLQADAIVNAERARLNVQKLEQQIEKLLDLYLSGGISVEAYKRKTSDFEMQLAVERTKANDSQIDELDAEAALGFAEKLFSDLPRVFWGMAADQRRKFVDGVFGGPITLTKDGAMVSRADSGLIAHLAQMTDSNQQISGVPPQNLRTTLICFISEARAVSKLLAAA